MNYNQRSKLWAEYRTWPPAYYHLAIDSYETGQMFHNERQFAAGMNSVAVCQYLYRIKIITFNLMVNHAHFLIWASGNDSVDFFLAFKKRINAQLVEDGFPPLPEGIGFKLIPIDPDDPYELCNQLIYIARNPYKANKNITPSGYLWGSNYLLFSDISKLIEKKPLSAYSKRFLEEKLRTRKELPHDYRYNESLGMVLPESYVAIDEAHSILKTSWKYCGDLVKNMDAYVKISNRIGARIEINDVELDSIIYSICRNQFNVKSFRELSLDNRCRLAVRLHKEYYIDPKRICRKLAISPEVLRELLM